MAKGDRFGHLTVEEMCANYRAMREFRGPATIKHIEGLIEALYYESAAFHLVAHWMQYGPLPSIRSNLAGQGFKDDPFTKISVERLEHVVKMGLGPPQTAADFTAWSEHLVASADLQRMVLDHHLGLLKKLRKSGGRYPSVAMDQLLEHAEREGVGIAELARGLAAANILPDGRGSDDPGLANRWEAVLKTAKGRRRKRSR